MGQKRRKLTIVLGLIVAVATASFIYLYTTPIDLSRYSNEFSARIEAGTGVRFSARSIVVRAALPSIEVTLEDVDFFEDSETFLIIPRLSATFSLLKMLTGSMEPRILKITEPDILVKRYSDGSPNLGARFLAGIRPTGTLKNLTLHNGRATIVDEAVKGGVQKTALTNLEISFVKGQGTDFTASLTADIDSTPLDIKSTGRYVDKRLRFEGTATLGTFDVARFNPYIKLNAPQGSLRGAATAELDFSFDRGITLKGAVKYNDLSINAPSLFNKKIESGSGTARALISIDAKGVRAGLDGIEFKMADFNLTGGIKLQTTHGAAKEARTLRLKLASSPISFKRFMGLLPPNPVIASIEKKIGGLVPLGGTVTVEELLVEGRMDSLGSIGALAKDGKVGLRLGLDNIKFTGRTLKETFSGIKGLVVLENDRLTLGDFSGHYGSGVLKEMNAEVTGLTTEPKYALSAKTFFEAGKTLEILKTIFSAKGDLNAERLKYVEASGITELNLRLKGGLKELTPTGYSGTVRLKNSNFSHKAMLLKLTKLSGEIVFDEKNVSFKDLKGTVWNSLFTLNGTVKEYLKTGQKIDITATGRLANETVEALSGSTVLKGLTFASAAPFSLGLSGGNGYLSSSVRVDFTGSGLKYRTFIDKRAGYPMTMEADIVRVEDEKVSELRIKNVKLNTGTSRAGVTGLYNLKDDSYVVSASTSELRVSDIAALSPAIDASKKASGSVGLSFKVARKSGAAVPVYEGVVTVSNAAFTLNSLASPVERLDMTARYESGKRLLDIKRFVAGRNNLKGKVLFTPAPASAGKTKRLWQVEFDLDATGLFMDDLAAIKKQTQNGNGTNGVKGARPGWLSLDGIDSGRGRLRISKGAVGGFGFSELDTGITITPEKIFSKEILLQKNGGRIASSITYFRADESPLLFDSTTVFAGIDLKQFIEELGAKKTIIEGAVSIDLELKGKRGATPVTAGLFGKAHMRVGQGKLWKFLVMSKFFSIINIFSIDELLKPGLPYKRITGDFDITDGVVRSNNIYLESDTLRMTAMGEISIPDQYIDSVLLLHPFVTIDKIVTKIPLAGWIIGGKEKSAASMYYEIVGPLKKPYIDPVPEKSISKGVKEMMRRLEKQLEGKKTGK